MVYQPIKEPEIITDRQDARGKIRIFGIVFLLQPLWWTMGIEQLVLPIYTYFAFALLLSTKSFTMGTKTIRTAIICYIFFHFVSVFVVLTEPMKTFYFSLYLYRTFLFLSGPLIFLLIINSIKTFEDIVLITKIILYTLLLSAFGSCLFYLLFFLDVKTFTTVLGHIVPSLSGYGIFKSSIFNEMIRPTWVFDYYFLRSRGFFTYSNLYAFALEIGILLSLFMAIGNRKKQYLIISFIFCTMLFLTTSRAGILSLVGGFTAAFVLYSKHRMILVFFSIMTLLSLGLLDLTGYHYSFTPQELANKTTQKVTTMRENSTKGRQQIYEKTFDYIKKKPLFGWGTYRRYPKRPNWPYLGSHSGALSFIFRMGIVGFMSFLFVVVVVFRDTIFCFKQSGDHRTKKLSCFLLGIIITNIVHMSVLDVHDDIFTLNIMWATWALAPSLRHVMSLKNAAYSKI